MIRPLDVASPHEIELRACSDALALPPQASLVIEVPLPNPLPAGRYELIADLVDNKMETYFKDMGSPPKRWEVQVE